MTTDPREAVASLQKIRAAQSRVASKREQLAAAHQHYRALKAELRKLEAEADRMIESETGDLPLFDQVEATAAPPARPDFPDWRRADKGGPLPDLSTGLNARIVAAGQPPGTVGHKLGAGAIADPAPEPEAKAELLPDGSAAPGFDVCSLHPPAKTKAKDAPPKPGKPPKAKADTSAPKAADLRLEAACDSIPESTRLHLQAKGATDEAIKAALAISWGNPLHHESIVTHGDGNMRCTTRGGMHLAFWYGAISLVGDSPISTSPKPDLQGVQLVARVRKLLAIPTPSAASRTKRVNKTLDRSARADQRRVEALPGMRVEKDFSMIPLLRFDHVHRCPDCGKLTLAAALPGIGYALFNPSLRQHRRVAELIGADVATPFGIAGPPSTPHNCYGQVVGLDFFKLEFEKAADPQHDHEFLDDHNF